MAPVQDPIRCVWSVSMRVACELCRELISMDWAVLIAVLIPCAPAANAAAQYPGGTIGGGGMPPMPKSEPAAAPSIIDGGGCKAPGVGGSLKSGGGALPDTGALGGPIGAGAFGRGVMYGCSPCGAPGCAQLTR